MVPARRKHAGHSRPELFETSDEFDYMHQLDARTCGRQVKPRIAMRGIGANPRWSFFWIVSYSCVACRKTTELARFACLVLRNAREVKGEVIGTGTDLGS